MIKKYIYCLSLVHLHSLPKYPVKGFWPTKGYIKLGHCVFVNCMQCPLFRHLFSLTPVLCILTNKLRNLK